ncbi:MAG: BolA/IbaG family iron-sulfur metabolism protein [Xenococcaceae cyanobacterium MO_207.B15]|nr:BolA/IbaG family iron-sulfur metabolism protein [Xenococcaceae cyanobacterium MO_207.B15]MDJ0742345.1 BolA/IbaG family iron-sulfur metabolism protein [Xenococcaceae cyanobacterium MO_167.B27]
MINPQQVKTMIQEQFPEAQVEVAGDGEHFEAVIVSPKFEGKSKVKQHQMVYAAVNDAMASEVIHALSLKTYTPEAWQTVAGKI